MIVVSSYTCNSLVGFVVPIPTFLVDDRNLKITIPEPPLAPGNSLYSNPVLPAPPPPPPPVPSNPFCEVDVFTLPPFPPPPKPPAPPKPPIVVLPPPPPPPI